MTLCRVWPGITPMSAYDVPLRVLRGFYLTLDQMAAQN